MGTERYDRTADQRQWIARRAVIGSHSATYGWKQAATGVCDRPWSGSASSTPSSIETDRHIAGKGSGL